MECNFVRGESVGGLISGIVFRGVLAGFVCFFTVGCQRPVNTGTGSQAVAGNDMNDLTVQAYRIILDSLADQDAVIRANAVEVVSQTGQIKLVPKVQRLLYDEFAPVRFASAIAIGDLEYSFGMRGLTKLFKDSDSNVKIAASYAMVRLGSGKYKEVLRRAIGSTDQTVRANAAFLIGKSGDREALKLLYWAMQDADSADKVSYQAAESIARLGDDRIYPKLWSMLISRYADVRVTGVRAMGALGDQNAKDSLVKMLSDNVLEVRLAAAEQLGKLGDKTGEPEVLDVFTRNLTSGMERGAQDRVYVLTALAIGRIATPALMEHLPDLLNYKSKAVRIAAARAVLQSRIGN
ncbi:MAG: HEAT repeat domain-containing protein [Planctomycetota bacterium]|jgi:HEAT repeat protein